jgi:hypothetical protein
MTNVSVHEHGTLTIKRRWHEDTDWVEIEIGDFRLTVFGRPEIQVLGDLNARALEVS